MAERPEIILKPEVCIESWVMLEKHSKEVGAQRALEWGKWAKVIQLVS